MMASQDHDPRRSGTIWVLDLDEPATQVAPLIAAAFFRLGVDSIPELAAAMGAGSSNEILQRFKSGRRVYAARVGDTIAAYGWVSFEQEYVGELNLRLRILPGEAYIWDCATLPDFRNLHLYSALLAYILDQLRLEGLRRAWIGTDLDNVASQHGIARAGFHCVAELLVARVLALRQVWVQGLPGVPEPLVAEARRTFLNDRDAIWRSAVVSAAQC